MTAGKILLVGNGFDLAHGLLTGYGDFLYIMKNWDDFYQTFSRVRQGVNIDPKDKLAKYLINAKNMDDNNLKSLGKIIKENSWAHYYCNCEAEIDGWIDFERELYPVMDLFTLVFGSKYEIVGHGAQCAEADISKDQFSPDLLRIAKLWEEYLVIEGNCVALGEFYVSKQYGILKKKIMKLLKKEFDEFIKAFEIYLLEFVHKKNDIKPLKQIKNINANKVISFNYTLTENVYRISEENTHHIHGRIREKMSGRDNDMVLGASERDNQNLDFIYFIKYFQRIQKRIGTKYKYFWNQGNMDFGFDSPYDLHIYGHSLDKTDEDILKTVMNPAGRIYIYYYTQEDYETKVINLIDLFGREVVEESIENCRFQFVQTSDETV